MKDDEASFTASLIATARGLGRLLPEDARLAVDPYGERFATAKLQKLEQRAQGWLRVVIEPLLLAVQVRTRLIDDALVSFARDGGRQVLILGAGFDARAHRFVDVLGAARVFEVDHPATQAKKRAALGEGNVTYLAWDFEKRAVDELPAALTALGLDATRPTLTIWEGVTMYLSEPAVDASLRAIAQLSAPGSLLAFTYFDRALVKRPGLVRRLLLAFIAKNEPITFGFVPETLTAYLAERGFALRVDVVVSEAGLRMLPARYAPQLGDRAQRMVFATRV